MNEETRRFLLTCRGFAAVWIILVLLAVGTLASAYAPFGPHARTAIQLAVVAVQVTLIAVFFMNLRASRALLRFAAVAGVYWLVIMFVLTFNDFASRPASSPCPDTTAFTGANTGLCDNPVR